MKINKNKIRLLLEEATSSKVKYDIKTKRFNTSSSVLSNEKKYVENLINVTKNKNFWKDQLMQIKDTPKAFEKYSILNQDGKLGINIDTKRPRIFIRLKNQLTTERDFRNIYTRYVGLSYSGLPNNPNYSIYNDIAIPDTNNNKLLKPDINLNKRLRTYFHTKAKDTYSGFSLSLGNLRKLLKEDIKVDMRYMGVRDKPTRYIFPKIKETLNNDWKGIYEKVLNKYSNVDNIIMVVHYDDKYIFFKDELQPHMESITNLVLGKDIKEFKDQRQKAESISKTKILPEVNNIKNFNATLFEHQQQGVSWMYSQYKAKTPGVILADDVGMGKTIQSIAFAALMKPKSVLVVCPASVIGVWEKEIQKFYPSLHSKTKIISYEGLVNLPIKHSDLIILDETQKIKNDKTLAHMKIDNIKNNFIILLSGTPIENKVKDLYSVLYFINPVFNRIYTTLKKVYRNENNLAISTRKLIDGFYLRRVKTKKILDKVLNINIVKFPPKQIETKVNQKIKNFFGNKLIKAKAKNNLAYYNDVIIALMRMRQLSSDVALLQDEPYLNNLHKPIAMATGSKLQRTEKLIDSFDKKDKIIIFSSFSGTIEKLKNMYPKAYVIQGSTPSAQRSKIIEDFQNSKNHKEIIIISLKAGNAGITLNTANKVIIYDLWWNPAVIHQAIARAYRIGQTRDVDAYLMATEKTIDENILKILDFKQGVIDSFNSNSDKDVTLDSGNNKKVVDQLAKDIF